MESIPFSQITTEKPRENDYLKILTDILGISAASAVILGVITLALIFIFCKYCKKYNHKNEKNAQEKEKLVGKSEEHQKKDGVPRENELQKEIEKLQKEKETLQREIDWRKAQFKRVWRKAPLYADWRKEEFKAVHVTLDEATAHSALFLSEKGKQVTWQENCQDLMSSTQRFDSIPCVLGQQSINSGRHFWEVEVGNSDSWDIGICRDNVTRKGNVTMSPQNGFWAIRFYDREYWALTSPETSLTITENPRIVGIFIDYEVGEISFYNMVDNSHIFTFSEKTFYGLLRPLFRLWSPESGSLTIRSYETEESDTIINVHTHS